MIGLGDRPAADVFGLAVVDEGHHHVAHNIGVAAHGGEGEGEGGDADGDGEVSAAPGDLLSVDVAGQGRHVGATQRLGKGRLVVTEFVCLAKHVPVDGPFSDDIFRRALVQLDAGGPQHFYSELVSLFLDLPLLVGEFLVQLSVGGHSISLPRTRATSGRVSRASIADRRRARKSRLLDCLRLVLEGALILYETDAAVSRVGAVFCCGAQRHAAWRGEPARVGLRPALLPARLATRRWLGLFVCASSLATIR